MRLARWFRRRAEIIFPLISSSATGNELQGKFAIARTRSPDTRDACATRRPPQFDLAFRRGSFYENLYENDLDFPPQICAATERRRCSGSRQACAFAWKTTRTQCCKYGRCALECKRKSLWTFAESA